MRVLGSGVRVARLDNYGWKWFHKGVDRFWEKIRNRRDKNVDGEVTSGFKAVGIRMVMTQVTVS